MFNDAGGGLPLGYNQEQRPMHKSRVAYEDASYYYTALNAHGASSFYRSFWVWLFQPENTHTERESLSLTDCGISQGTSLDDKISKSLFTVVVTSSRGEKATIVAKREIYARLHMGISPYKRKLSHENFQLFTRNVCFASPGSKIPFFGKLKFSGFFLEKGQAADIFSIWVSNSKTLEFLIMSFLGGALKLCKRCVASIEHYTMKYATKELSLASVRPTSPFIILILPNRGINAVDCEDTCVHKCILIHLRIFRTCEVHFANFLSEFKRKKVKNWF